MFGFMPNKAKAKPAGTGAELAQAQNQAPDSIPGMFKPGEFVLPPDTVHAMGGKNALQGMVDAIKVGQIDNFIPFNLDGDAIRLN